MSEETKVIEDDQRPEFIYGGPFIGKMRPDPLIDSITPMNVQLQGIFQRSFAYHTVRERLPIIITKVIDFMSRARDVINKECGATEEDLKQAIQYCTKLKSDIVTNKKMDLLTGDSEDCKKWNSWIEKEEQPYYFTAVWVFTECYVYRRLREAMEHNERLVKFDPFFVQKDESFTQNLEAMCVVADKLTEMLQSENVKESLVLLLKLALWANKCDLSLSNGAEGASVVDPVQSVADNKDKLLVDDTGKIVDFLLDKAAALAKKIEESTAVAKCSCNRMAAALGMALPEGAAEGAAAVAEEGAEEEAKPPCPSKMVVPPCVMFDIVCDNSGYELFADLCIGHFLVAKNIVKKVRFHVKQIPWFVSDVTPRDFGFVVKGCAGAVFSKQTPPPPPPPSVEGEEPAAPGEPGTISSDSLKTLGAQWSAYVEDGSFVLMWLMGASVQADSFWVTPHVYKDMKKYDEGMYRKLQFAVMALFKGDLNYRKLLGEKNWNPVTPFETALQGFIPTPLAAIRTVKADIICGLPKGKAGALSAMDDKWMEKGEYGVIQFCPKKEELKVTDKPCAEFGQTCTGQVCPAQS